MRRSIRLDVSTAERDLVWFFHDAAAAIGFRAANLEPSTPSVGTNTADDHLVESSHRLAVQRSTEIAHVIAQMAPPDQCMLAYALTRHGSHGVALSAAFTRAGTSFSIAGLAPHTMSARLAFATFQRSRKVQDFETTVAALTEFLDWEARQNHRAVLAPVRKEAFDLFERIVARFVELRSADAA